MPGITVNENEPFEIALRRFKKQCEKAGIISEVRKRQYYEKPSIRKKKNLWQPKNGRIGLVENYLIIIKKTFLFRLFHDFLLTNRVIFLP